MMGIDHTNINDLTWAVNEKADLPLKFYFDGTAINPGYHVTEVRAAEIHSVDCGKNSDIEKWNEITVQLLDGSATSTEGHMQGSKFMAILGSALKSLQTETASHLFFEYAPENGPIRKLSVESVEHTDSEIAVSLGSEKAVCKPFQRALAAGAAAAGVVGQSSGESCCADGKRSDGSSCCA